jgi:hypothetical protein
VGVTFSDCYSECQPDEFGVACGGPGPYGRDPDSLHKMVDEFPRRISQDLKRPEFQLLLLSIEVQALR